MRLRSQLDAAKHNSAPSRFVLATSPRDQIIWQYVSLLNVHQLNGQWSTALTLRLGVRVRSPRRGGGVSGEQGETHARA